MIVRTVGTKRLQDFILANSLRGDHTYTDLINDLDPDRVHIVREHMLHNDRDIRAVLWVKLYKIREPKEIAVSMSINDFIALSTTEV